MNTTIEERLLDQLTDKFQTVAQLATSLGISESQVQTNLVAILRRRLTINTATIAEDLATQWRQEEAV